MRRKLRCDYCRLQNLQPSDLFQSLKECCVSCGSKHLTIPGYAEAHALPNLSLNENGKVRSWHANVSPPPLRLRNCLAFEDPLRRKPEAAGEDVRKLLKACGIDCCYHFPAPFRLAVFSVPDGALAGVCFFDVLTRYVNAVAVSETFRRHGVASALLRAALEIITDAQPHGDHKPASLYVTEKNAADHPFLVEFYRRRGFDTEQHRDWGLMHQVAAASEVDEADEAAEAARQRGDAALPAAAQFLPSVHALEQAKEMRLVGRQSRLPAQSLR
ncbi:hypothetical protein M885DRAFT_534368 [Pelagophyceae sp. CCMP2097]|nr:hypothetical protein M885DRAFT_534368 [Pelagophyceae sp. CCMP2097]